MLSIGEVDVKGLRRFENMLGALGENAPRAVVPALNRTGDMARTKVIKALAAQTSLSQKMIRGALKIDRAHAGRLEYRISAQGGDIALKHFKPRETRRGVSAFVGGERKLFERTFTMGGSFATGRVPLKMGGHVFLRVGSRTDLVRQKSGVFLPIEMVEGETAAAFNDTAATQLPRRLDHEITRLLGM